MSLTAFPWAHYTHEKGTVKLHTLLDLDMKIPDFIHITDGKQTDAKSAFEIPVSQGEVIVADRGYQDFKLLRFGDSRHAFFVVRHRLDISFDSLCELDLPDLKDQHILKDEIIFLKIRQLRKISLPITPCRRLCGRKRPCGRIAHQ